MNPDPIQVLQGDCRVVLAARSGDLFDACVTDPPYELGFMGRAWDRSGVAFQAETWRAVFDQLRPGAHLVAFGGTRTYHRMTVAIEDAGFEIRDQLAWAYGSGFPKSVDLAKAGAGEPWQGWGTALKPAWEPICLARKPLDQDTIVANVIANGTGGINIDGCRVSTEGEKISAPQSDPTKRGNGMGEYRISGRDVEAMRAAQRASVERTNTLGRFPANLLTDGSDEVLAAFPSTESGLMKAGTQRAAQDRPGSVAFGLYGGAATPGDTYGDTGSAARFFYSAKAGPLDRLGSEHPTVKPVDLMRWLVRLVTPPGGLLLDPFAGSGTTGIAALAERVRAELIDLEPAHVADIETKLAHLRGEGGRIVERHLKRRAAAAPSDALPLFGGDA